MSLLQSIRGAAGESVMSPKMGGKLADAMRAPVKGDAAVYAVKHGL